MAYKVINKLVSEDELTSIIKSGYNTYSYINHLYAGLGDSCLVNINDDEGSTSVVTFNFKYESGLFSAKPYILKVLQEELPLYTFRENKKKKSIK